MKKPQKDDGFGAIILILVLAVLLILGGFLWLKYQNKLPFKMVHTPPNSSPNPTSVTEKSYDSVYFKKNINIEAPNLIKIPDSLFTSGDRLNGVIVKDSGNNHFLIESDKQVLPVVVKNTTQFYLSKPSTSPPSGPFSGDLLSGDYSSSLKEMRVITVLFQIQSGTNRPGSIPWVKDADGSYIAKAILLYEI